MGFLFFRKMFIEKLKNSKWLMSPLKMSHFKFFKCYNIIKFIKLNNIYCKDFVGKYITHAKSCNSIWYLKHLCLGGHIPVLLIFINMYK